MTVSHVITALFVAADGVNTVVLEVLKTNKRPTKRPPHSYWRASHVGTSCVGMVDIFAFPLDHVGEFQF